MWEQIRANQRKSAGLVVVMALLLFTIGYLAGEAAVPGTGLIGLVIAFIVWIILSLASYFAGGSIMLAVSGARKIAKADLPRLFDVVEEMQIASGLPKMPDIYVIDDPAPNAFATGRDPQHAAVAVTSGLLNLCNRDELQGVISHEMAHVRNRDVLWKLSNYAFIACPCGVTLKIPPNFKQPTIQCPRCQRTHDAAAASKPGAQSA